jgi:WD40 repeat protein
MADPTNPPEYAYDLFVSYRRKDGLPYARWVRQRLLNYRLPPSFGDRSRRRLRVFQDTTYERATADFWNHTIEPALKASRYLAVVVTPGVFETAPDGAPNWVEREITTFTQQPQGDRVFVLLGSQNPVSRLPCRLEEKFPHLEQIDVGPVRPLWRRLRSGSLLADRILTVAAALHEVPPEEMPVLRREQERRRRRLAWSVALASMLLLAIVSGLAFAWWTQRNEANYQARRAIEQAQIARRNARLATARRLAAEATLVEKNDNSLALLLAESAVEIERNPQTLGALLGALEAQPELMVGRLGTEGRVVSMDASLLGSLLVLGGAEGIAAVWDTASILKLREIAARNRVPVTACRFDGASRRVAIGDASGGLRIAEVLTGKTTDLDSSLALPVRALAFSGDGTRLAVAFSSNDRQHVGVWNTGTGKMVCAAHPQNDFGDIESLFLRPDGTLGVFDWGHLLLFSASSGMPVGSVPHGKFARPGPSAYSRDGAAAVESGLDTGSAFVYDPSKPRNWQAGDAGEIRLNSRSFVDTIAFSADNSLLAIAQDGRLKIFKRSGEPVQMIPGLTGEATSVVFSGDGARIASLVSGRVQLWNRGNLSRLALLIGTKMDVPSVVQGVVNVVFSPSGKRIAWVGLTSSSLDGDWILNVWDKQTAQVSKRGLGSPPTALGFLNEDSVGYALGSSPVLRTVDLKLQTDRPKVNCAGLAPDSAWEWVDKAGEPNKPMLTFHRCLAGVLETRDLWSLIEKTGIQVSKPDVYNAALSADARRVAFSDKQERLTILDTQERLARTIATEPLLASSPELSQVPRVALSPDGRRIVLDLTTRFGVFDADALLHTGGLAGAASLTVTASGFRFSPDSRWLAFEMGGGALELWDAQSLILLGRLQGDADAPYRVVRFDASGKQLAEAVSGGGLTLWDLDPDSWMRKACAAAGRTLSEQERSSYIPENGDLYQIRACQ